MGAKLAVWSLTLIPGYGNVAGANEHAKSSWVECEWHVACGIDRVDKARGFRMEKLLRIRAPNKANS